MRHRSVVFLVIAIIAAIFGFTGIIEQVAFLARVVFFLFFVLCAVEFVFEISFIKKK